MRSSLIFRLYAGLILCVLLVLAVGFVSYHTIKQQIADSNWINHSYKVINTSQLIRNRLLRIETNEIAYRNDLEKHYLKTIDSLKTDVPRLSDSLVLYTKDNLEQNRLAIDIQQHIKKILLFWDQINRDNAPLDSERMIEEEDVLFGVFNSTVDRFQKTERELLKVNTETSAYLAKRTVNVIIIGLSIVFVVVIVLWYAIRKELSRRLAAQKELSETIKKIEQANTAVEQKNRQLEGLAIINSRLQESSHDLKELTQNVLETLISYMKIPAGIFYVYDEELQILEPVSCYAIPEDRKKTVKLGDNLPGHAALNDAITEIVDLPSGYWKLESGLGTMDAAKIIYLPLYDARNLKGLIELVVQEGSLSFQKDFLELITTNVAKSLNNCIAHTKMLLLMEQINQQNEELKTQKESLSKSHEKIKIQAEELLVSEEELKVQQEELLQVNAELETQNEELEHARRAIQNQKEALEKSSSYKSEFLANMSHELRTPLNSILVLSKLMSDNPTGNLTKKQQEYNRVIHKSGSDLLNLINDILDLSKIEAGKMEIVFKEVQIKEVIQLMETLFREIAKERGLKYRLHLGKGLPKSLTTDQRRLEQILKNLLSNSFKFTPAGGEVVLNTYLHKANTQQMLCFEVTDTGIGIPKEKQKEVFLAFQQIEGTISRKYTGTGLGLSISTELVKRLGGFITLESEPDRGSTFAVYIPLEPLAEMAETISLDALPTKEETDSKLLEVQDEKKKIILVDNAAGLGKSVYDLLENDPTIIVKYNTQIIEPCDFLGEAYDLLIYCLGENFEDSILLLEQLMNCVNGDANAVIVLIDRDISAQEETRLRKMSHTIIHQSIKAEERLRDELNHLLKDKAFTFSENKDPVLVSACLKGRTILVADDDMRNIFALTALLEEQGAEIVVANNGEEALAELEKNKAIALVLMDIMMPVMDGLEAIEKIRKQFKFNELPIIALTAKAMYGDKEKCIQAGASDYVTKPLDPNQLLNLIKIWLVK